MSFNAVVKEKIARTIGDFFTTNQIVNVFTDANIPTERELFAKWRIILDAFGKMSDPGAAIPHILEVFCHPLNFQEPQIRVDFIEKLNAALVYENLKIKATGQTATVVDDFGISVTSPRADTPKTPIDYVVEAVNFFKDEYNKIRMAGLAYEYFLGEDTPIGRVGDEQFDFSARLNAIERLKGIGFITEYTTEAKENDSGTWVYALCKIDESKITQKEASATEAGVRELIQKIEITAMPKLQVENIGETPHQKNRKREAPIELSFPEPVQWDKVTLKIKEGRQEVEIFYDNSHIITADYRQLRFFVGKRQQKPDRQWGFLCALATLAATDIKQATAENMRSMITQGKTLSANNVQQVKKLFVERLQDIFKTSDDPFHDKRDYYEPKFKLLPEPALRREEVWPQGGRLNENLAHEDSEEEAL